MIFILPFMLPIQFLRFSEGKGLILRDDLSVAGDLDGALCFADLLNQCGTVRFELGNRNLVHDGLIPLRAAWPF